MDNVNQSINAEQRESIVDQNEQLKQVQEEQKEDAQQSQTQAEDNQQEEQTSQQQIDDTIEGEEESKEKEIEQNEVNIDGIYYPISYSLGWYKFLTKILWPLEMLVLAIITASMMFTIDVQTDYLHFIILLIANLLLEEVISITNRAVRERRSSAPGWAVALYVIKIAIIVVVIISINLVVGIDLFNWKVIIEIALAIIMAIVNMFYFSKRKDLFIF